MEQTRWKCVGGGIVQTTMRALSIMAVLLGLAGVAPAQNRDQSATGETLQGEYSAARAMQLLYSDFDTATKVSVWTPGPGPKFDKSWPDTLRVQILTDGAYTDDGVQRHVLVSWAKPVESGAEEHSCHACGVLLGVAVFRKEAGGWKVESSALQLDEVGAWGKPPQVKVQRLGVHTWGLATQMGDMHQGEVEQALWIYGPKTGGFSEWFKAQLVDTDAYGEFPDDNWCKDRAGEMDVMCIWRERDYAMREAAGKEMYELVMTQRTKSTPKLEVYRFNGSEFVKVARP